jgi:general secretion pathway protein K
MTRKPSERGVALLTTLLLVAVMAAIAVAVLDDIRFAVRRTANMRQLGQAQWYALGAETLAKSRLQKVLAQQSGFLTLAGGWSGLPLVYPIDNGSIQLRLTDRGACFNLNSVVAGEADQLSANPAGAAQYRSLLVALEIPESEAAQLTDALTDWIDTDSAPSPFGVEDEGYARGPGGYRTASALLAEETELRVIRGYSPEVYARLRPYVCALPLPQLTDVNINTLSPRDAPVLTAVYQGRLSVETARRLVEERPLNGWPNQSAFLQEPLLQEVVRNGGAHPLQQLVVRSRFFLLDGRVLFAGASLPYSALIEAHPSGQLLTVARRWTPVE